MRWVVGHGRAGVTGRRLVVQLPRPREVDRSLRAEGPIGCLPRAFHTRRNWCCRDSCGAAHDCGNGGSQSSGYPGLADVVARSVHDVELVEGGKFRPKGAAETVSVLAMEHTVFDAEDLT